MPSTMPSRKEQIIEMLESEPQDTFLRYGLAMELQKEESFEEAEKLFRELMSDEPAYVPAYFMLGQMLVRSDRSPDSIPVLQQGIEHAKAQGNDHAAMEMSEFLAMLE